MTELFGLGLFGSVFGLRLIMPRVSYACRGEYVRGAHLAACGERMGAQRAYPC